MHSEEREEILFGRCVDDFLTHDGYFLTEKAVHEMENQYIVEVSVPGFSRGELELSIEKDLLVLRGYRKYRVKQFLINRSYRNLVFQRSFVLPSNVSLPSIHAQMVTGLLRVFCPKNQSLSLSIKSQFPIYRRIKVSQEGEKRNGLWRLFE